MEGQLKSFEQLLSRLLKRVEGYSLDTDACNHQIGCAIVHIKAEITRLPIVFWSRRLSACEMSYSIPEKEYFGVGFGITTRLSYLVQEDFDVHTDHQ